MVKAEQIPDEVVEAVARVLAACHSTEANWEIFLPRARASIVAAINAWPGMEGAWYEGNTATAIILPLPQEVKQSTTEEERA